MSTAPNQLRSFVERVERIEEEIKAGNDDKRDIFAEAKSQGFDVKALKTVIARRRKDPHELLEHDAIVETYWAALASGTRIATRVHAHEADLPPTADLPRVDTSNPPFNSTDDDPLAPGGFLHRERQTA